MRRSTPVALAAIAWTALVGAAQARPPDGAALFIDLPLLFLPYAVGANGFVVAGARFHPEGRGPALHWLPTSGVREVGGSQVIAVSRDGKTMVGSARDGGDIEHAAIWAGGESWRLLAPVHPNARPCDTLLSSAFGASDDARVIVGLAWDGCSFARAFRWEVATGMTDLGSLSGESTRANDVSGDGRVVVGWEQAANGYREGAKWVDGREELIKGPGGFVGEAFGVNRDGSLITGTMCDSTRLGPPTAWTWTPTAGIQCFPVARPVWALNVPYDAHMYAMSDDGRVIGGAISFGLDSESVVWFDGESVFLHDYLRDHGVPDAFRDWYNTGFVTDVSPDGRTLVGHGVGPRGLQGFMVVLPELARD
jgi:probable HAF family extracellular repeat protein